MTQLIILGNGFDIQSGLASKYIEFYRHRIKEVFGMDFQIETNELDEESQRKLKILYQVDHDNPSLLNMTKFNMENKDMNLTFWDLVMIFKTDKELDMNWCNIEAHIEVVTKEILVECNLKKEYRDRSNISLFTHFTEYSRDLTAVNSNNWGNILVSDAVKSQEKGIDNYTLFMGIINNINDDSYRDTYLDEFLLHELNRYEIAFKEYINEQVSKNEKSYNSIALNLLEKIYVENEDIRILNFNYTLNNHNQIKGSKIIGKTNIHGSVSDDVIFGVDHNRVESDSIVYPFTKTFRKLVQDIKEEESILNKDIRYLIFYGHSLGEADYSYFQSIFDYLNIYESEIYLKFYFTNYTSNLKSALYIKRRLSESVQKLLHAYGNSMDNSAKGKNLIHKLLLENRVQILEVDRR